MLELLLCRRAVNFILSNKSILTIDKCELKELFININDVGTRLEADDIAKERLKLITSLVLRYGHIGAVYEIENLIKNLRTRREDLSIDDRTRSDMWLMIQAAKRIKEETVRATLPILIRVLYSSLVSFKFGTFTPETLMKSLSTSDIDKDVLNFETKELSYVQNSIFKELEINKESCLSRSLKKRSRVVQDLNRKLSKSITREEFDKFLIMVIDLLTESENPVHHVAASIIINEIEPKIKIMRDEPEQEIEGQLTLTPKNVQ